MRRRLLKLRGVNPPRAVPEMASVRLTAAVLPLNVFSARQPMDAAAAPPFTVTSRAPPGAVKPPKVQVKLQGGEHRAEHRKRAGAPTSRTAGPVMTTSTGPSEERGVNLGGDGGLSSGGL